MSLSSNKYAIIWKLTLAVVTYKTQTVYVFLLVYLDVLHLYA